MTDLYATLGVRRNASTAAIRKAYHRATMKHHPDRGGDREEFEQVHLAYKVLSDSKRRKKYDATGEIDVPIPDNSQVVVLQVVSQTMVAVLQDVVSKGGDPLAIDLLQRMRSAIADTIKKIEEQKAGTDRAKQAFAKIAERFSVDEGENILANVARTHLAQTDSVLAKMTADVANLEKAKVFLKRYKYRMNAATVQTLLAGISTTTATGYFKVW